MLKRLLSLLLVLALLLPGALAEDVDDDILAILDNPPNAMATLNGHLYIAAFTNQGPGLFRPMEDGWLCVMNTDELNSEIVQLTVHQGTLYLLLRSYILEDEGMSPYALYAAQEDANGSLSTPVKVTDVDLGVDENSWPQFYGIACDGTSLYLLLFDYDTMQDYGNNMLVKVSLTDGSSTRLTQDYLQALAMTPDGLIGLYSNWSERDSAPTLVQVDTATAAFTTLTMLESSNASGLIHDEDTGYLYTVCGTQLMRWASGMALPELCGYLLPGANVETGTVCQEQFLYATYGNDGDYIGSATVDPAKLPSRTLRLVNYGNSDILYAFCKEHPEIAVVEPDSYGYTAEAISQEMLSGGDSIDVYAMTLPNGAFTALRDKGYVADLSASTLLTDTAARMYPQFTRMLYNDAGKLIAFPCEVHASGLGYYPAALEKVGLTEDDLPKSLDGLMDFIRLWQEDYAEDYPEITLFGDYAYAMDQQVFSLIFMQRVADCAAAGELLTFNTPEMRTLLAKWEQLRADLQDMSPVRGNIGVVEFSSVYEGEESMQLFTTYASLTPERYGRDVRYDGLPLLLSLTDDTQPHVSAYLSVYFVNPNSPNLDLALQWLEFYAEHMQMNQQIILMPDVNEPQEYPYYQQNLTYIQESLNQMKAAMEEADDADKPMYAESIAMLEQELAENANRRWAISEQDIADYREIAPMFIIADSADFLSSSSDGANEASKLIQRYLDGQLGAEQFIRELDRMIQMMQMENY
ncbi:MAG: extracellular solute-binding protein [Aristaeellaceae bacterium]